MIPVTRGSGSNSKDIYQKEVAANYKSWHILYPTSIHILDILNSNSNIALMVRIQVTNSTTHKLSLHLISRH